MLNLLACLRGHVYPRTRVVAGRSSLHALEIILGMLGVIVTLLGLAYAITLAAA
ncbi:hypothetical protein [Rhizobium deserti]|uniref:hypothetical protein n=1 Tax=Rhizobium deserti TaxID=2547961 RepID=UPI00138694FB|nr:hypothetical protein [Rhizobium deserti]